MNDFQPNLFQAFTAGGVIEPEPPAQTKREKRLAVAQKTLDAEDDLWRTGFRKFILTYAAEHKEFTPEDVRHKYAANKKLPQPKNWRSSGNMFKKLADDGYLKRNGMSVSQDFGCPTPTYSIGERREEKQFQVIGNR